MKAPRWLSSATLFGVLALVAAACGGGQKAETRNGGPVRVGAVAPDFTLPSAQGGKVSLAKYRGHQPVLLYFSMGPG
jgi:cytochrome oxidase Cu insertion factor (SCO1/SenC/PrrC family)